MTGVTAKDTAVMTTTAAVIATTKEIQQRARKKHMREGTKDSHICEEQKLRLRKALDVYMRTWMRMTGKCFC